MGKEDILKRIEQNKIHGEELVTFIEQQIPLLQKAAAVKREEQLTAEILEKNKQLKIDLEYWKKRVIELEVMNGIEQYPLPGKNEAFVCNSSLKTPADESIKKNEDIKVEEPSGNVQQPIKQQKKESANIVKKEKNVKCGKNEKQPVSEENKEIDVSRLDLRIGRILTAKRHPDAESLYVEEIDVGEDKPRTVVSGLVKYVPLEEMQNRLVVVLCNLKPAKMRGITSAAMVMCASTPDKVEILSPPSESVPGERVICDEYPGEPEPVLPPKKKIFEQVAPDLKTNGDCVATYKSAPLKIINKGIIKSLTLANVQIK